MTAQYAAKYVRRCAMIASALMTSMLPTTPLFGQAVVPPVAPSAPVVTNEITDASLTQLAQPAAPLVPTAVVPVQAVQPAPQPAAMPADAVPHGDPNAIPLAPGEVLVPQPGMHLSPKYPAAAQGYPTSQGHSYVAAPTGCAMPCPSCPDRRYVMGEALYMKRTGDEFFTLSDGFALDEFDYELGLRVTTGYVMDCMDGIEASFVGWQDWHNQNAAVGTVPNPLNLRIPRDPAIPAAALDTFYNAQAQFQDWKAEYYSFEVNQRNWGWDVISILHGVRVISYDERFRLGSRNFLAQDGLLQADIDNLLLGLQVGIDMFYPVTQRISSGMRGRAGGYINFADSKLRVANNGVLLINAEDDDESLAGVFELGFLSTFQVNRNISIRTGYELWYIAEVATVPDNTPAIIRRDIGRNLNTDGDVFFNGITLGAEFKW